MLGSLLKDLYARGLSVPDSKGPAASPAEHERWTDDLLLRMFQLMHHFEQDNFDSVRYGNQLVNVFLPDRHAAYFCFWLKNSEKFFRSRQLLEDESSRELYDRLILFRILGHLHVRLPFNTTENRAHIATAESWRLEETKDIGAFGPLSI